MSDALIGQLVLPFLATCMIVYLAVMGWIIYARDKYPRDDRKKRK
jgi:hypothetical protein